MEVGLKPHLYYSTLSLVLLHRLSVDLNDSFLIDASIEVNMETSPSYYKDVPVTIKCDYSFADADYARFGVLLDDSVWMGCAGIQTSVDVAGARLKEEAGAPEYTSPSEEDCKTAYDMLTSTGNTSLSFTVSSINTGSYTCSVRKLRRSANSAPVEVSQVKGTNFRLFDIHRLN